MLREASKLFNLCDDGEQGMKMIKFLPLIIIWAVFTGRAAETNTNELAIFDVTPDLRAGNGTNANTNQLMVGEEAVDSEVVDGKIAGDRWITVFGKLLQLHGEIDADTASDKEVLGKPRRLRLMMLIGGESAPTVGVDGLLGLIYMAKDWKTQGLAITKRVEAYSTKNKARIVILVPDENVIYTSTNSGLNWRIVEKPGIYNFPLTLEHGGSGFYASATLWASPKDKTPPGAPPTNWIAVVSAGDKSKRIISMNSTLPTPVLNVTQVSGGIVVSWLTTSGDLLLQENGDISTTNWIDVANSVQNVGPESQVFIPLSEAKDFFRLRSR